MNDRFDRKDLIERLMLQNQLEQAGAEAFVKTFLTLVKQVLVHDKYLKIKGLGTFRLTEGERGAYILSDENGEKGEEHFLKISFMPDMSLKDAVNKPFAQFESVLLKEGVRFDDVPEVVDHVRKEEEAEQASGDEEGSVRESVPLDPEKSDCPTKVSPFRLPWYAVSCVLLVGILIGVFLAWAFVSGRQSVSESSDNVPFKVETENSLAAKDSCEEKSAFVPKADSVQIQAVISAPSQHENVKVSAQSSSVPRREGLADTVEYDIVGTQTVHTLRSGESLARIALKFYGNKRLWPYIVKHNSRIIRNPDNIPVGTKIRIPILSPRK